MSLEWIDSRIVMDQVESMKDDTYHVFDVLLTKSDLLKLARKNNFEYRYLIDLARSMRSFTFIDLVSCLFLQPMKKEDLRCFPLDSSHSKTLTRPSIQHVPIAVKESSCYAPRAR